MEYVALYRKWRPQGFSELVGQEHVSRTLAQAIVGGRVGHAYLFSGPRGTGKTSTAKILAKALNCEKGPTTEPCNECESCRRISDGTSMDVMEIDAASNRGIDEIRELRETVKFAPTVGRYKVYIIDEVHMLTSEAFNALLKTLEEPPPRVVFILATTELQKVPATIQSRCQRYDFKRIAAKAIEARLREVVEASGVAADDAALALVAREADGGLRDALSTLDQCISLAEGRVTETLVRDILGLVGRESVLRILRALSVKDGKETLAAVAEVLAEGKDAKQLIAELIAELRAAMVYQAAGIPEGVELHETDETVLKETAALFAPDAFLLMLRRLHDALAELRWTTEPRIAVETALLSICHEIGGEMSAPSQKTDATSSAGSTQISDARVSALLARIDALEKKLASGAVAAPIRPAGTTAKKTTAPRAQIARQPAAPTVQSSDSGAGFVRTQEGEEVWKRLLAELKADAEQNVVYACASKGTFGGMTATRFRVCFQSAFLAGRLDLPDYRNTLEAYLERLTGTPLTLTVEVGASPAQQERAPKQPTPPKQKTAEEIVASLPPKDRAAVQKAVDIFGPDTKIVPVLEGSEPPHGLRVAAPKPKAAKAAEEMEAVDAPPITDEDFARLLRDSYIPAEDN